ncbi:hypothetical protein PTTG_05100 [Puccinia triticina 1-1 BBBD Race 1]|uniref:Uncharacterized protein n=1 Tax=Puccinia triticina (isolate 1-1 / race 1 (BBBD)) TaxID=630390 RepID=A0A0C4EWB0_PUCT1|nr:hypothetical protein PTTG_05100 [Puccinia triticina 1-1 BBBD Race 1]
MAPINRSPSSIATRSTNAVAAASSSNAAGKQVVRSPPPTSDDEINTVRAPREEPRQNVPRELAAQRQIPLLAHLIGNCPVPPEAVQKNPSGNHQTQNRLQTPQYQAYYPILAPPVPGYGFQQFYQPIVHTGNSPANTGQPADNYRPVYPQGYQPRPAAREALADIPPDGPQMFVMQPAPQMFTMPQDLAPMVGMQPAPHMMYAMPQDTPMTPDVQPSAQMFAMDCDIVALTPERSNGKRYATQITAVIVAYRNYPPLLSSYYPATPTGYPGPRRQPSYPAPRNSFGNGNRFFGGSGGHQGPFDTRKRVRGYHGSNFVEGFIDRRQPKGGPPAHQGRPSAQGKK